MRAQLVFLSPNNSVTSSQLITPLGLHPGDALDLVLCHPERWRRKDVTRVIVGSEPTWADVVLVDEPLTIRSEHARFYLNHLAPERSDFRAMKGCPAIINGQLTAPFTWVNLRKGDTLQLSCWRFRYEWSE